MISHSTSKRSLRVSASATRSSGARARGFTLIELMVVVVIISVLAVIAVPAMGNRMRDRRVQAAAQEVSTVYRNARLRALGRGSAVLVRYVANGDNPRLEVREAVRVGQCAGMPVATCFNNGAARAWNDTDSVQLSRYAPQQVEQAGYLRVEMQQPNNATLLTNMDVCFTPMGRSFISYDNAAMTQMTGVPVARVWRADGSNARVGLMRTVLIPPNGVARLGTAQ